MFDQRLDKVLRRIDRRLVALGQPRAGWQTWQLVAGGLKRSAATVAPSAQAFADAWDRARYGGGGDTALAEALAAAEALDEALAADAQARKHAA